MNVLMMSIVWGFFHIGLPLSFLVEPFNLLNGGTLFHAQQNQVVFFYTLGTIQSCPRLPGVAPQGRTVSEGT